LKQIANSNLLLRSHPSRRLAANTAAEESTNALVVEIVGGRDSPDQLEKDGGDDNNMNVGKPNSRMWSYRIGRRAAIVTDKATNTRTVGTICEQNKG
jgi:hypothetical protein